MPNNSIGNINKMNKHIHKINGVDGKTSLSVVIPHTILENLNIVKGDFVEIDRKEDKIIIRKLKVEEIVANTGIGNEANLQVSKRG